MHGSGEYCWESRIFGMNLPGAGYTRSRYGFGERQCPQGSKGNEHLRGTRGKDDGMLRESKEVEPEAHPVSAFSEADSWSTKPNG